MDKAKKTVIEIQIDDWVEEWQNSPVKPRNQSDIIAAMQETPIKPTQMGRLVLAGRELGEADADILRPNRLTLLLGAAYQVTRMIGEKRVDVQVGDKTYSARQFIANVENGHDVESEESSDAETAVLVDIYDALAVERATKYLFTTVCGFIWERMLILAANKQDVEDVADTLKVYIDNMVERLT